MMLCCCCWFVVVSVGFVVFVLYWLFLLLFVGCYGHCVLLCWVCRLLLFILFMRLVGAC